jgi:RNA polymerase sigma-70 factor (ECF subfamily)
MTRVQANSRLQIESLSDVELARLCADRNAAAVRHVITCNNQRLFRTAWSILKDRSEAEDAVQAAYLSAFGSLDRFEGRSSLSTWLTRIVINEALGRLRTEQRRRHNLEHQGVAVLDNYREMLMRGSQSQTPDAALAQEQVRRLLEQAVGNLPDEFRTVFVMRDIESMSGEETAEVLGIPVATVKTRLLRARRRLRELIAPQIGTALAGTLPFAGADCAALTDRVMKELGLE